MYDIRIDDKNLAGSKRKAEKTITSNLLPIDRVMIEYQPDVSHIKDKEVRKNTMNTRIRIGPFPLEYKDEIIQNLKKDKLRFIKVIPVTIDLPLKCPSCGKVGSPTINDNKRVRPSNTDYQGNEIKKQVKYEKYLIYHHEGKKNCRIGKYEILQRKRKSGIIKPTPSIKLKKSLDYDSLGYSRRVGTYPLQ